jgi:hypothetical protein
MRKRFLKNILVTLSLMLIAPYANAITNISIQVGEMQGENLQARNVQLNYRLDQGLSAKGQLKSADGTWSDTSLSCKTFSISKSNEYRCEQGRVASPQAKGDFNLLLKSTHNTLAADVSLRDFSFSDAVGLHAGEKVAGRLLLDAAKAADTWSWKTSMDWTAGEVFWQPLYFANGGHKLNASGVLKPQFVQVDQAIIQLKQVGDIRLNGRYLRAVNADSSGKLETLKADGTNLDLATLYPLVLKPLLEKTSLNNLEIEGRADFKADIQNGTPNAFQLDL